MYRSITLQFLTGCNRSVRFEQAAAAYRESPVVPTGHKRRPDIDAC